MPFEERKAIIENLTVADSVIDCDWNEIFKFI